MQVIYKSARAEPRVNWGHGKCTSQVGGVKRDPNPGSDRELAKRFLWNVIARADFHSSLHCSPRPGHKPHFTLPWGWPHFPLEEESQVKLNSNFFLSPPTSPLSQDRLMASSGASWLHPEQGTATPSSLNWFPPCPYLDQPWAGDCHHCPPFSLPHHTEELQLVGGTFLLDKY